MMDSELKLIVYTCKSREKIRNILKKMPKYFFDKLNKNRFNINNKIITTLVGIENDIRLYDIKNISLVYDEDCFITYNDLINCYSNKNI